MKKKKISYLLHISLSIVIILINSITVHSQNQEQTISDFIGINSFLAEYNPEFLEDISQCSKWIREYHNWSHYEKTNDQYLWNDTTNRKTSPWAGHYKFMENCQALGINVLIDVLGRAKWADKDHMPINSGDGSKSEDYIERIEFISQLVARYGSTKIDTNKLETSDKISGLGYIKYFEDDNEPDYWWETPAWEASSYAQFCNAVHDGYGLKTSDEHPLLGIKSVDPNAKHVIAGLAALDTIYITKILKASDGRIPFDVLNVHQYCSDHEKKSFSPENEKLGFETVLKEYLDWKNRVLPNIPIWMTEFGWDTYKDEEGNNSYAYANELSQANYLLRSYFLLLHLGFDKAFMYMASDTNSKNKLQYATCGLFKDKKTNREKKPSFYYMASMQKILGDATYLETNSFRQAIGENEIYSYKFHNKTNETIIYALWTRKINSEHDSGIKTKYDLQLDQNFSKAFSVIPQNLDMDGDTINISVQNKSIELELTETPLFVILN